MGLTQEGLAHKVGMSYSSISDLERGLANPTFQVILRIAAALDGWDVGEWLSGLTPDDAQ
ncbi:hypothetical protein BAY59_38470 (plasmid) [Prauserella coralliicola]|nr:hypothetical protein BAY59_38470 [Prauserella coralliicola]